MISFVQICQISNQIKAVNTVQKVSFEKLNQIKDGKFDLTFQKINCQGNERNYQLKERIHADLFFSTI